jgi:uncharacterized protein (TIGR00369 family)
MPHYLEWMRRVMRGEIESAPIAKFMGFTFTRVEPGEVSMQMPIDERHLNPMGSLHGGIYADLADAAMGCAFASTLEAGETSALFQLNLNIVRPMWTGILKADARVVQRGRNLGVAECRLYDGEGRLVGTATATCTVLRGDQAKGR